MSVSEGRRSRNGGGVSGNMGVINHPKRERARERERAGHVRDTLPPRFA